jgi:uncharacterized membrane protein
MASQARVSKTIGNQIGKGIATVAIWGGTAGLSYLFHSFDILTGEGAAWMVVAAVLLTAALWKLDF